MKNFRISQSITDRQDESLKLYFREVSRRPVLTPEEEIEITTKVKQGDERATKKLIESNLRFVISVAKQYQGKGLPLVDLIQEGNIGLIEGTKHYNPDKGFKFISYVVWWIRQAIMKALSDQSRTIRVPISQVACANKLHKTIEKFEQSNGRKPSIEELEENTNISSDKINSTLSSISKSVSLESPFKDDDASCLLDVIPDNIEATDESASKKDINKIISSLLSRLPYRDRDILRMSYGIGMNKMTNEEIANRFGIGSERVRQLKHSIIDKVRTNYLDRIKKLV